MQDDALQSLRREIRRLRIINAVSLTLLAGGGIFACTAVQRAHGRPHFDEIDVGRINIVEPDGTLRLAISNKAHFPDNVIDGKTYTGRSGPKPAGMIFYNDAGDENGGLIWNGQKTADGYTADGGLTFDQWRQDQTVELSYDDENGKRWAGLRIVDRPEKPLSLLLDQLVKARQLPEGPQRDSAMTAVREYAAANGLNSAERIVIGKDPTKAASVKLNDPNGKTRILIAVDSLGAPRLQFLDASGKVTYELPGK
jgi:hypothetical protein